jgi:hypothetical protein
MESMLLTDVRAEPQLADTQGIVSHRPPAAAGIQGLVAEEHAQREVAWPQTISTDRREARQEVLE